MRSVLAARPGGRARARAGAALLLGVLVAGVGALVPAPAVAQEASWSVRPGDASGAVVALTVRAHAEGRDALVVTNEGAEPLALAVAASDTRTGDDGGLEVADTRTGAGAWLDVPDSLELAPGEQGTVPVRVAVPAGTPAGEYVAAVVTTLAEPGDGVTLERRLALRVVVTVPEAGHAWARVGPLVAGAVLVAVAVSVLVRRRPGE